MSERSIWYRRHGAWHRLARYAGTGILPPRTGSGLRRESMSVVRAITIRDVARQAGVSLSTVSQVLNGRPGYASPATRDRVLTAARELGYAVTDIDDLIGSLEREVSGGTPVYSTVGYSDYRDNPRRSRKARPSSRCAAARSCRKTAPNNTSLRSGIRSRTATTPCAESG